MKLILFLMLAVLSLAEEDETHKVGELIKGEIGGKGVNSTYIALTVPKAQQDSFLFIVASLQLIEEWQGVKFMVVDSSTKEILISCSSKSLDGCYLPSSLFPTTKVVLVVVECQSICHFQLQTYWSPIHPILESTPITVNFKKSGKAEIYEFNHKDKAITDLKITIQPLSSEVVDRVKIYVNTDGTLPSLVKHQFESITLWGGGQGIFLNSKQLGKEKITLLILGEANIDYILNCQALQSKTHNLTFNKPYNDFIQDIGEDFSKIYRIIFEEKDSVETLYSIKMSVFTGNLIIGFYKDPNCTLLFQSDPFLFMGNSKYTISSTTLQHKNITVLYAKIMSKIKQVTFTTLFTTEPIGNSAELVHQQYLFRSVPHKQLLYVNFKNWYNPMHPEPTRLVFNSFSVQSQSYPLIFRTCEDSLDKCTNLQKYQTSTTVISNVKSHKELQGTVDEIYLSTAKYHELTAGNKMGVIIIEITPNTKNVDNFIALYFKDQNVIQQLTQQQFTISEIPESKERYFFFLNQNPSIKTIIIHSVEMNGKITATGYRTDPRRQQSPGIEIESVNNTMMFFDNLTQPIYVKIIGVTRASFVITTLSLTEKINPGPITNQTDDSLLVAPNKDYTFILKTGQTQIISIMTNESEIVFHYHSTGRAGFCQIEKQISQCTGNVPFIGNKVDYTLTIKPNQLNYIRMMNMNPTLNIQVTVNYITEKDIKDSAGKICLEKEIGKLGTEVMNRDVCLKFMIDKLEDIRGIFLRTQMSQLLFGISLCDKPMSPDSVVFQITKKTIEQYCGSMVTRQLKIYLSSAFQKEKTMKLRYIVQYVKQTLYLPQGIAHYETIIGKYGPLKRYYFRVLNRVDTEVKIHFKKGSVSGYLKVVNESDVESTLVTAEIFDLSTSSNHFFTSDPSIKISGEYLKERSCHQCVLVIQMYTNDNLVGNQIIYTIEIIQGGSHQLQQHEQQYNFLPKNSVAYFKYECKQKEHTIIFDVQDNNRKCAKIYLGVDEYPSENSHISMSVDGVITGNCDRRMNYLSVEALADCPVSVSAQSSDFRLTKISSGIPVTVNMEAGQVNYFVFTHFSSYNFKFFLIEESGRAKIYMTVVNENIINNLQSNTTKLEEFMLKSEYTNSIQVSIKDKQKYCQSCSYIVAVSAETKLVNAEVLLVENNEKILMTPDKVIYDELDQKETTQLQYFNAPKGFVKVNAIKNDFTVSIYYNQKTIQQQVSSDSKEVTVIAYNFINNQSDYDWRPIQVKIFNKGPNLAVYSIHLTKDNDPEANAQIIKEGLPTHLSQTEQCVRGFFHSQKLTIYLSAEEEDGDKLSDLKFIFKINNQSKQIKEPKIMSNSMQISYTRLQQQKNEDSLAYVLCVSNIKESLKKQLGILQSSQKLNLLAVDRWTAFSNESTFLLHPQKEVLLDIFTCQGELDFTYSSSFSRLADPNEMVSSVKLDTTLDDKTTPSEQKNHAIYITSFYDLLFLKISTPSAIIRWMDVDRSLERGVGYERYTAGDLDLQFTKQTVKVKLQAIKPIKETSTSIYLTSYRLFMSTKIEQAKSWANCEIVTRIGATDDKLILNSKSKQTSLEFAYKRQDLQQKYKDIKDSKTNLYILVVADVTIRVPNANKDNPKQQSKNIQQNYRFMYTPLKIPIEAIITNIETPKPRVIYYVGAAAIIILTIGLLLYLIIKKIVPIINRLRTGDLQLEEEKGKEDNAQGKEKDKDDSRPTEQQIIRDPDI